jgi:hypothetical protein
VIGLFDTGFLFILFDAKARVRRASGKPVVERAQERYAEYLTIIRRKAVFEIAGFNDPEARGAN